MADAYTQLTDLVIPEVWSRYMFEESVEKLDLYQAGIIFADDTISGALRMGGYGVKMPYWEDLDLGETATSEPVNDDPTDMIDVNKVTTRTEYAVREVRAKAWGNMDINAILAGDDPQRIIIQRQSNWWQRANKNTILSILDGIVADNVANDDSDLTLVTGASITETDAIDAAYLMGDRSDDFKVWWMHSNQMKALKKLDLIDFVPYSQQGGMMIPYYMGLRVITDDSIPATTGADVTTYTSYMLKERAIYWAEMPMDTEGGPLELHREPRAGHGGGMTETVSRRHFVPHLRGFTYTGTPADEFATDAELATATSWDRATPQKKTVGFIAVQTTESTPGTTA